MDFLKKPLFYLILILILASFLRLYNLGDKDKGINVDEALVGYEAYSILKTGYDHNRTGFLPLYFKGYSEEKDNRTNVSYSYLTIPFVATFGLNIWTIRLPAVVLGVLTVFFTYLLAKIIFDNKKVALLSAFLLAISPWHLTFSRFAETSIEIPFLTVLGLFLFLKGVKQNKRYLIFSLIPWAAAAYSYPIAKIFIPLLALASFMIYRQEIKEQKKEFAYALSIAFLILLPSILLHLNYFGEAGARFRSISIFREPYWFLYLPKYFLLYFSPEMYLSYEFFYLFEYPFLILGLIHLFILRNKKEYLTLLFWFLFFPVAVSLTLHEKNISPIYIRAISGLPVIQIIEAFGIYKLIIFIKEKKSFLFLKLNLIGAVIFVLVLNIYLLNFYTENWLCCYLPSFNQVALYIKENGANYDKIIIDNKSYPNSYNPGFQHYMHLIFYLKYPPKEIQALKLKREHIPSAGLVVTNFDKYYFVNAEEFYQKRDQNLYFVRPFELPQAKATGYIFNSRGQAIYKIVDNRNHD